MKSFPEHLRIAKSAETLEAHEATEEYLRNLESAIKAEVERILKEEAPIGEGRAGQVFEMKRLPNAAKPMCLKVWRPELQEVKRRNLKEYRSIQAIEPEEEFDLQDKLFMQGFRQIPRPIAYGRVGEWQFMTMDQVQGYTLQEIEKNGAQIGDPAWENLYKIMFDLNINQGVVHRDLHTGNIMLKTDEPLKPGEAIKGELMLLDLGLAKRIYGRPEPEDYKLTIGQDVIQFPQDKSLIDKLKPVRGSKENLFAR